MTGEEAKKQRLDLGRNQTDYWGRVLVTQSSGSHYELGREVPEPVQALLLLAYGARREALKEFRRLRG